MSTASRTKWTWPPDVLAYAARHQVSQYLDPLLEMTQRLFPTGSLRISVYFDRELREVSWIALDAEVPRSDVGDYVEAVHRWNDQAAQLCPAPLRHHFTFSLNPVTS
jgi:hypothetical protein